MKNTAKRDKTTQSDESEALPKPQNADPQQPDHITHITHMVPPNPDNSYRIHINQAHLICTIRHKGFNVMRLSDGIVVKFLEQDLKNFAGFYTLVGEVIN